MPEVKPEEMVHHPPMDQLQEFEYCIDSNPSWGETITLGFQHYILSLGTAVMIPTMLVPLMGGNDKCKRVDPLSLRTVNGALPCIPVFDRSLLTPVTVPIIWDANIKNDIRLRIFSVTANPSLSQEIESYLGLELGKINIKRFAEGEIYVQFQESARGCDVFLVQPVSNILEI